MDKFVGKWKETGKEGFKEFAEAVGVDDEQKAIYEESTTELEYQIDGGQWTMVFGVVGVPQAKQTYNIKLGETYTATDIDGLPMTSLINIEGDSFVESHTFQKWPGIELSVVRRVGGDIMTVTTCYKDSALKTLYARM